jgi:hypothetical protein
MKLLKVTVLQLISILLYFPIVTILFLYLLTHPSRMNSFYFGIEALLKLFNRKK